MHLGVRSCVAALPVICSDATVIELCMAAGRVPRGAAQTGFGADGVAPVGPIRPRAAVALAQGAAFAQSSCQLPPGRRAHLLSAAVQLDIDAPSCLLRRISALPEP